MAYTYWALVMHDKIDQIKGFTTEVELDTFSKDMTKFSDEEIAERLAKGNDYGGAVIFGFAAPDSDAVYKNNFDHPVAVYLRGEKYDCIKRDEERNP